MVICWVGHSLTLAVNVISWINPLYPVTVANTGLYGFPAKNVIILALKSWVRVAPRMLLVSLPPTVMEVENESHLRMVPFN